MDAHIALNRLGLGARPGEAATLDDPAAWLDAQLVAAPAGLPHEAGLPSTGQILRTLLDNRGLDRQMRRQAATAQLQADVAAWWTSRRQTDATFFHRWWAFFGNHFAVSAAKRQVVPLWGVFQRDALRPHVLGRFEDLLLASSRHPAMLLYLDNAASFGPDSRVGQRGGRGLNENLAREILELHTLGVDGGYSQADVQGLAALITGWSVARRPEELARDGFVFRKGAHQPGSKQLLGQTFPAGEAGGEQALRMLANHPQTRRHVCTKLARHFVEDVPSRGLISDLEDAWERSNGTLAAVGQALVRHPDVARPEARKLKTPQDLVTSVARALPEFAPKNPDGPARALGQPAALVPSPAGWDDEAAAWLGPEGMLSRIDLAVQAANRSFRTTPDVPGLARDLLGTAATGPLLSQLAAARPRRALTLMLASPAFQRR